MKHLLAATAAMAFTAAAPVAAQQGTAPDASQAAKVEPGASVYGSDGGEIGTVAGAQGNVILLRVGERTVPIDVAAISSGSSGPTIPATRAELVARFDQQMAAYQAKVDAALTQGAPVQTADNQSLGTIESISGNAVAVKGSNGSVNLPKAALALDEQGTVTVRATMEQVRSAMGNAAQSR